MDKFVKNRKVVGTTRFFVVENPLVRLLMGIVLFIALFVICLVIGIVIGYVVIGGGSPIDVFNWSTWQHILDFLK